MIGSALCFVLNSCIMLLYDTFFFLSHKKGEVEGVTQIYTVWYDILNLFRRIFLL